MHFFKESVQYGMLIRKVSLYFVLSSTEYEGLTTGDGNSLL